MLAGETVLDQEFTHKSRYAYRQFTPLSVEKVVHAM